MVNRSLLILAGGIGHRMEYTEKSLIPFKNQTIIEYVIDSLKAEVDEIIISVRDAAQKELLSTLFNSNIAIKKTFKDIIIVKDRHQNIGPLAGILEGFKASKSEFIFVAACDMPFINPQVVKFLFECAKGHDVALPIWDNKQIESLHAVYKREPMILEIENSIKISHVTRDKSKIYHSLISSETNQRSATVSKHGKSKKFTKCSSPVGAETSHILKENIPKIKDFLIAHSPTENVLIKDFLIAHSSTENIPKIKDFLIAHSPTENVLIKDFLENNDCLPPSAQKSKIFPNVLPKKLSHKETKILTLILKLNSIAFVNIKKIQEIDENLSTFTNINTLKDLEKLKCI